jgi:hypothetical protein
MSGMLSWITGNSSAQKRKAAPKDAIVALRAHMEMLQKRERHLQNLMDEQDAIARRHISTNKNGELLPQIRSFICFFKSKSKKSFYVEIEKEGVVVIGRSWGRRVWRCETDIKFGNIFGAKEGMHEKRERRGWLKGDCGRKFSPLSMIFIFSFEPETNSIGIYVWVCALG